MNLRWSRCLMEELRRGGVRHVCICPGKRSLPLAAAALADPGLETSSHVDERSAGFFALGLAKAGGAPVAVVTTSGTAGAHLHPAAIEADLGRVPLVLLTADRPPRLRDCGAPQTVDQVGLFGGAVRWFADVGLPLPGAEGERTIRSIGARAVARAAGLPAGPVQLNLAFDEPLCEAAPRPRELDAVAPWVESERPAVRCSEALLARIAMMVHDCRRGLIVCGPLDPLPGLSAAVKSLAWRSGYPVLADPLSGLRCDPQCERDVLGGHDSFLRDPGLADALAPQLVLRLGAPPTSQALAVALERWAAPQVLVDPAGACREPGRGRTLLATSDELAFCRALAETMKKPLQPDLRFRGMLDAAERQVWSAARAVLEAHWFEGSLAATTVEALPDGALLWVASSKPVRELDSFLRPSRRSLRILASRGANGIDGLVSQAAGAAWAARGAAPVVLLCGDLALLHDIGGLLAARRLGLALVIVVANDDGGRIFDALSIKGFGADYEQYVATSHGMTFEDPARAFGLRHRRVTGAAALREALARAIAGGGSWILEAPLCARDNLRIHQEFHRAVRAALTTQKGEQTDVDRNLQRHRALAQRG